MKKITVITGWAPEDLSDETNLKHQRPAMCDDHSVLSWTDITAQPVEAVTPDPNTYVISAIVEDAVLIDIDADPQYTVLTEETI